MNPLKVIEVEFEGRLVKGYAVQKNGVLWMHAEGETWTAETGRARKGGGKSKAGSSANPGEILAPMPGKIIKISAPVGQAVAKGDVVMVMEAMKMEYTLKAAVAGVVSEIKCAAGDQVPLGALLAKLDVKT